VRPKQILGRLTRLPPVQPRDALHSTPDSFNRQHMVLWDIVIRDTVGPVAFLALALWALAVVFRLQAFSPGSCSVRS
jgi:hypothetical protein